MTSQGSAHGRFTGATQKHTLRDGVMTVADVVFVSIYGEGVEV